jgi:hypothetical protein
MSLRSQDLDPAILFLETSITTSKTSYHIVLLQYFVVMIPTLKIPSFCNNISNVGIFHERDIAEQMQRGLVK